MKLGPKLMLAPALTGAVLALTLGASVWVLHSFKTQSAAAGSVVLSAFDKVAGVRAQLADMHTQLYRTVTIAGSMSDQDVKAFREKQAAALDALAVETGKTASTSTDEGIRGELNTFITQIGKYRKAADAAIDLATVDANTGVAALQTADGDYRATNTTLAGVLERVKKRAEGAGQQLDTAATRASLALALLGALAVIGAMVFSWFTQRRIVANVRSAADAAVEVAQGRLDVKAHSSDQDEVGDMVRALDTMVSQLRQSIQTVRNAADSIGTASAEIATGNQDLSARTEQTASNLQQAASSMEQLTGTVKQSADSARQANQLASSAAEVAARGGSVVSQVVSTMQEINSSSKKIADIIGVIDGIAFQTNILALNAAVEAARAGEQGRGFAVVAGEVRNLAQRSAEAAKEIKSLIGSSVDKVESGSKLVADAGATMNEIVASVQRVSDIIGEITAAASEQSDGIGQVNTAVTQLDQMTQQNAALVEQSAAAAESLKDQALRLAQVVGTFRLDSSAAVVTPAAPPAAKADTPPPRPAARPAHAERPAAVAAPQPEPQRPAVPANPDGHWETF
jgi:methyl-accepting chemotaxis protein